MEIGNFTTLQGYECLSSCIVNCFQSVGINILPIDILINASQLKYKYRETNGSPIIDVRIFESNFQFLDKIKLPCKIGRINESKKYEFIESCLMQNKRLIICVAADLLNYNSVYKAGEHIQHFVNVIGIDTERGMIKVSDGCTPSYANNVFEDWIPDRILFTAWEKMDSRYIMLDFRVRNKMNLNGISKRKEFSYALQKAYSIWPFIFCKSNLSEMKKYNQGINKITGNPLLIEQGSLIRASKSLKINGVIAQKQIILQYLQYINMDTLIIDEYQELIQVWNNISIMMIKISMSQNDTDIITLKKNLENLALIENDCAKKIVNYIREKEKSAKDYKKND